MITVKDVRYGGFKTDMLIDESVYNKIVADTVDKCLHIIQEIHDKKLYCLEDLCIGDGRTCDECAIDIIKTSLERIKGDNNDD